MHVRPVRLNAAVAGSFSLGSTCFVVGSVLILSELGVVRRRLSGTRQNA